MNGLSLHYYTLPTGNWSKKGSATEFGEADWFATLNHALHMDDLVTRHSAIMDRYDPQKKIGLIVDEWGAWYDVEPGTNPGFLYQQNTLRDALVAGVTLNIFNQHCDRVKMAAIAQLANVLQAMVLTDKEKMTVTPSYWVFEMYVPHHDATLLPSELQSADYTVQLAKNPGGQRLRLARQIRKNPRHALQLEPEPARRGRRGFAGGEGAKNFRPGADRAGNERAQHI